MRPSAGDRLGRHLAAILAADVVGYSRLMGADEVGTLFRLKDLLRRTVTPAIEARDGRVVGTFGDGLLAEFGSVADAVACAIEIQRDVAAAQANAPADDRLNFRIGINLGDVIQDGDDIFGDGVNIAARLQSVAEPTEICVSGAVHDAVRNKLQVTFLDRGEQQFKNIAQPIRVYAVAWDAAYWAFAPRPVTAEREEEPQRSLLPRPVVFGLAAACAVVLAAAGYGFLHPSHATAVRPPIEAAQPSKPSTPPSPAAKKPDIPAPAVKRTTAATLPAVVPVKPVNVVPVKHSPVPSSTPALEDAGIPVVPAAKAPPPVSDGTAGPNSSPAAAIVAPGTAP